MDVRKKCVYLQSLFERQSQKGMFIENTERDKEVKKKETKSVCFPPSPPFFFVGASRAEVCGLRFHRQRVQYKRYKSQGPVFFMCGARSLEKRRRANGGCLGFRRRRRTRPAAKIRGDLHARIDPRVSEWGNPCRRSLHARPCCRRADAGN